MNATIDVLEEIDPNLLFLQQLLAYGEVVDTDTEFIRSVTTEDE